MASKQQAFREDQSELNVDQLAAVKLAGDDKHKYHLFFGSAGSGKSFLIQRILLLRAMRAPGSRHIAIRATAASCRDTLFDLTLRKTVDACFPDFLSECEISESEMHITLPNGSKIFYAGLNDEQRMQKLLGNEYNTVWFNECNEFNYRHVSALIGRLRYKATALNGKPLKNKLFADCNPASKKSWEYKAFVDKVNPISNVKLPKPNQWVSAKLRTEANLIHVGEDYIDQMEDSMTAADLKRYRDGEWSVDNEGGLFKQEHIDLRRVAVDKDADVQARKAAIELYSGNPIARVAIALDPAVSDHKDSDESGILVIAECEGGHFFPLEDLSQRASPKVISEVAASAYVRWGASAVVVEKNQGGKWLESTLRGAMENMPIKLVHASEGKRARAEPVSDLYERGKVHHVGTFGELETQMVEFGGVGNTSSPDRMDALVWGITYLANLNGREPSRAMQHKAQGLYR